MVALTDKDLELIRKTHDTVIEIKTTLFGKNSDEGLIGEVRQLSESHYKLKRNVYLFLGILIGSGILAGNLFWLFGG